MPSLKTLIKIISIKLIYIIGILICFIAIFWLLSSISILLIAENPSYSFNEEHAKEIFFKYDLKNNSNPLCNDYGCASINPTMADAWKDLCSLDGICDGHDAYHLWYSNNIEVQKVKLLWIKLNNSQGTN